MSTASPAARLQAVVARLCRIAGIAGLLICGYALIDPSILPPIEPGNAFAPPSPRWRAAFGLVFSLLVLSYGLRPLAHRERP